MLVNAAPPEFHNHYFAQDTSPVQDLAVCLFPTPSPPRFMNPTQEIRIMDFIFPLDSTFLENTKESRRTHYSVVGNMDKYKKVTSISYNDDEKMYIYKLEQKFPGQTTWDYTLKNADYFIGW
jgi:hypothetical protein